MLGCPEVAQMLDFLVVSYLSGDCREQFFDGGLDNFHVFLDLLGLEVEIEFLAEGVFAVAGDEAEQACPGGFVGVGEVDAEFVEKVVEQDAELAGGSLLGRSRFDGRYGLARCRFARGFVGLQLRFQKVKAAGQYAAEDAVEAFPVAEEGFGDFFHKGNLSPPVLGGEDAVHGIDHEFGEAVVFQDLGLVRGLRGVQPLFGRDGGEVRIDEGVVLVVGFEPFFELGCLLFLVCLQFAAQVTGRGHDGHALLRRAGMAFVGLAAEGFDRRVLELGTRLQLLVKVVQVGCDVIEAGRLLDDGLGTVDQGDGGKLGFEELGAGMAALGVEFQNHAVQGRVMGALVDNVRSIVVVSDDSHIQWLFESDAYLDGFCGLALVFVHDIGIDLRGGDVGVRKQLGDGVDGGAVAGQDGGVGVTEVVESDVLVDAGILDPVGDAAVEGAPVELVEDGAFLALPEKLVGFLVDGDNGVGAGLLGDDLEGVALVGGDDDVVPGEALDVGDTEAA